jgi:four helix bundle protein
MATFERFEDIEAWQKARRLTAEIYGISKERAFLNDFGLRGQIQRSSVSVMANIAEGFERDGTKEFTYFLSIAKGSLGELKTHLYVAFDQGYIGQETFNRLFDKASEIGRMIGGLMNYLRTSQIKGTKYK